MGDTRRILIAGESWVTHAIHQKGFDSFTTTWYTEGVGPLRDALEAGGFTVDYLPSHVAARSRSQRAASDSGCGRSWKRISRPARVEVTSPARSSRSRCLAIACREIVSSRASAEALTLP